jgi:hypothetical protein
MARRKFKQAPHYRTSKKGKKFKAGRGSKKTKVKRFRRPSRNIMSKYKSKSYNQIKKVYPIHPLRDDDGDKKRNWEDCRPFDKKKQHVTEDELDYLRKTYDLEPWEIPDYEAEEAIEEYRELKQRQAKEDAEGEKDYEEDYIERYG